MAKGEGLQNLVRYKWKRQPNGNYTVFGVPFFQVHPPNPKDETIRGITREDAEKALERFYQERERGVYPRIHEDHHNRPGSTRGIGYIDEITLGEDGVFRGDFAEISPEDFASISLLRWPGRSAEYIYGKNEIRSLALLETESPYFRYPNLALEEAETEIQDEQSFYDRTEAVCHFSERMQQMPPEEEKDQVQTPPPEEEKPEEEAETYQEQEGQPDMKAMIAECLKEMLPGMLKNYQMPEIQPEKEMEPMPVALSALGREQAAKFAALEKKIADQENAHKAVALRERVIETCNRLGVESSGHLETLGKFSDYEAKATFVDYLATSLAKPPESPATEFARAALKERNTSELVGKFSAENYQVQAIARQAEADYFDTLNQHDEKRARQWSSSWPSAEGYVAFAVDLEKQESGSYKKFVQGA